MNRRAPWELKYGLQFTSGISTTPTFATGGGLVGIGADKFGLLLTNHPDFSANKSVIDTRKSTGLSTRRGGTGYEFQPERVAPTVSLELSPGRRALSALLWLLFQTGASQGAGALYKKTFVPYHAGSGGGGCIPECYCSLLKDMSGAGNTAGDYQLITGAICQSLTLNGQEAGELSMSTQMLGAAYATSFSGSPTLNFEEEAPLLFKDVTINLGGSNVNASSFNFTITNNAVARSYNNGSIQAFVLKDLLCSGSIMVPAGEATAITQVSNHLNQAVTSLILTWGTASSNEVKFTFNIRITNPPLEAGGDELEVNVNFEAVATTSAAITVEVEDSLDRGIS